MNTWHLHRYIFTGWVKPVFAGKCNRRRSFGQFFCRRGFLFSGEQTAEISKYRQRSSQGAARLRNPRIAAMRVNAISRDVWCVSVNTGDGKNHDKEL